MARTVDQHRRMTRTLFCLVASMTVGALFLDVMKPSRIAAPASGIELAGDRAWSSIAVDTAADLPAGPEAHFLIFPNGEHKRTAQWEGQQRLGHEAVIRIVIVEEDGQSVTPAQRAKMSTLVRFLQERFSIADPHVQWPSVQRPAGPAGAGFLASRHDRGR